MAEAGPGDFIYVPPYVPHQEINASTEEPLECVLVRSDNEAEVVNLDIAPVEALEEVGGWTLSIGTLSPRRDRAARMSGNDLRSPHRHAGLTLRPDCASLCESLK